MHSLTPKIITLQRRFITNKKGEKRMHNEIKKIAEHYGLSAQLDQTVEECAELIQAINKYKRKPEDSTKENISKRWQMLE